MRIAKIKIPIDKTKTVNLKEIDLTKKTFGPVVALIGQNGSGKSRILNFIEKYITDFDVNKYFENHLINLPNIITDQNIQQINSSKRVYTQLKKMEIGDPNYKQLQAQLNTNSRIFLDTLKIISRSYIKKIDNDELQKIKKGFNNNSLQFENILSNLHFDNFIKNPQQNPQQNNIILNEINEFNNTATIEYLKKITLDIVSNEFNLFIQNRNDLDKINNEIKKNDSFQLFEKFQFYVKKFLGKEFSYKQDTQGTTINSILHFNNQPFNIDLLSPGQKTLFAYSILFFYLDVNSKANINESIIIIDEPEKHLHPDAQIKLIDAIKSIIKDKGQLWIATHSIHILSHLEFDEILMVKDDEIIPPSRTIPGKSFNDLMGLEGHIDELSTFINSISEWAYANFMKQCFNEPDVIFGNSTDDPQFKLFKEFLNSKSQINLLDYGAGKGRIGYTITEDEETSKKVIYSAFEPNPKDIDYLKGILNIKAIYNDKKEIPENNFDCVILCNVLHEISPREWVETLENIKKVINSTGYLLIIEDLYLPKGENANEFGYLILGFDETKKLLQTNNNIELKLIEKEMSERILFNAFTKDQINHNQNSVISAIELLNKNSLKNLKVLRKNMKKSNDVSIGRKYANQTQLYINSLLALENLKK